MAIKALFFFLKKKHLTVYNKETTVLRNRKLRRGIWRSFGTWWHAVELKKKDFIVFLVWHKISPWYTTSPFVWFLVYQNENYSKLSFTSLNQSPKFNYLWTLEWYLYMVILVAPQNAAWNKFTPGIINLQKTEKKKSQSVVPYKKWRYRYLI